MLWGFTVAALLWLEVFQSCSHVVRIYCGSKHSSCVRNGTNILLWPKCSDSSQWDATLCSMWLVCTQQCAATLCMYPAMSTTLCMYPAMCSNPVYVPSNVQQPCVCTQLCAATLGMYPAMCSNPGYVPSYVQQHTLCMYPAMCSNAICVCTQLCTANLCMYSAMCSNTVCVCTQLCTVKQSVSSPAHLCVRLQQSFIQLAGELAGGLYRASFNLLKECTELHLTCWRSVQSFI